MVLSHRLKLALAPTLLLIASCVTGAGEDDVVWNYGCDDVLVVGRAEVTKYTSKTTPEDILGHGVYELNITIKSVRQGDETRDVVPAYYHAHNRVRSDTDILFILAPTSKGYEIKGLGVWDAEGKRALAKNCS